MKPWLTAHELAGLAGMPASEFRCRLKLEKLGVPSRMRPGPRGGGGREYNAAHLPAETQAALLLHLLEPDAGAPAAATSAAVAFVPAVSANPGTALVTAPARPPSRQDSACADARALLLRHMGTVADLVGVTRAAKQLAAELKSGTAAPGLLAAARVAHQRARIDDGADRVSLSVRTLFEWHTANLAGGWHALLPAPVAAQPLAALADDVLRVLREFASTAGSSRNLTECARRVNAELGRPFDEWEQLYGRARRAVPKLDRVKLLKARHSGAERAAKLPFKRRLTAGLKPNDVWLIDGHTFKAKVRHPDHGAPFAPEVTLVIDAATRRVVGWSISLSENTIAVGDALRHAVSQAGVPAIVYSDNGPGEKAKQFDCPIAGLFVRLGCEHKTGIPGHPQGHGLIERSWQTHMIRCARQFATYQGSDADDRTVRNMRLELEREQRAIKRQPPGTVTHLSPKCPSWRQFFDAVEAEIATYNGTHRHSSLPKHEAGAAEGKRMTPDEAWEVMLDAADQVLLDAPSLRNIFMPAVVRTAQRGEVSFLNAPYFSRELMQAGVDTCRVRVHYDIHDAARVWVWSLDGRYICEAVAGANAMGYMPVPAIEHARAKRVAGIVKRRSAQIETAERELQPTLPAMQPPVFMPGAFDVASARGPVERVERVERAATAPASEAEAGRPFFDSAADRYEWLMTHRSDWHAEDGIWIGRYVDSPAYAGLRGYFASRGIDWPDASDDPAFKSAG